MDEKEKKPIEISSFDELKELLKLCGEDVVVTLTIETEDDAYEWRGVSVYVD